MHHRPNRLQASSWRNSRRPATKSWRKLVEAELKGAPFDKKMFTATYEGITLKPIYRKEETDNLAHVNSFPGYAPFVRGIDRERIPGETMGHFAGNCHGQPHRVQSRRAQLHQPRVNGVEHGAGSGHPQRL